MSAQYPHNQAWGNRQNETNYPPSAHQPPAFEQGGWQPQLPPAFPPQAPPTQQTYLNNNVAPKAYHAETQGQPSWKRAPPTTAYLAPQANPYQPPNHYPSYPPQSSTPNAFSNSIPSANYSSQQYYGPPESYQQPNFTPEGYQQQGILPPGSITSPPQQPQPYANSFPGQPLQGAPPANPVTRHPQLSSRPTPPPHQPTPPIHPGYQATLPPQPAPVAASDDGWGWGWDESSSDSTPATSTPNNNWGSQTPASQPPQPVAFTSAQNYFRQAAPPSVPSTLNSDVSQLVKEPSPPAVETVSLSTNRTDDPSPVPQQQLVYPPAASNDAKRDRASPEPRPPTGSTLLTTQALREFHREGYSNGPSSHRLGTEGLTPQWSIESQMSQETISDDASPSLAGTSDADHTNAWQEDIGQNHFDGYLDEESRNPNGVLRVRADLYPGPEMAVRMSSLSISEQDAGNKEVISPEQPRENSTPLIPPPQQSYIPPTMKSQPDGTDAYDFPPQPSYQAPPSFSQIVGEGAGVLDHLPPPPMATAPSMQDPQFPRTSLPEPPAAVFEPPAQYVPIPMQRVEPFPPRQLEESTRQEIHERNEELTSLEIGAVAAIPDQSVNLETVPDNKERPDLELRTRNFPLPPPTHGAWYGGGPDNHEVSPHSERDQYLETEQLTEQGQNQYPDRGDVSFGELASGDADQAENLPPPGLSRLVTGEGHYIDAGGDGGMSVPPAGLDRMVLGQITDPDSTTVTQPARGSPPPAGLDRMVLGQVQEEQRVVPSGRRLVPGESSSPETSQVVPTRVVPGGDADVPTQPASAASLPLPVSPGLRRQSVNEIGEEAVRSQPQAERSETIGSESVAAEPSDTSSKHSKRREKDHYEDVSSDERESGRRGRDGDYYRDRDRDRDRDRGRGDREDSPSGDRRRVEWNRRRRHSPQRYREYREDRRRRRDYDYSDEEDAETAGYNSDRAERDRRNMSYREDYDRGTYPRREDRARSLKPDKQRDRPDDRKEKDKRRGYDRERDRDSRQGDYYRRRPDHDDYREDRSRPSSRNDSSIHEFKHRVMPGRGEERDSEREHYRTKRERDAYYQQAAQYNYDPAMYYYYQQYYENLRRTNPAAYNEWYRKYYASSQQGTYSEDRASVHSGRSSADDTKDRVYEGPSVHRAGNRKPQINSNVDGPRVKVEASPGRSLDTSMVQDEVEPQRLTPSKFSTAHAKGVLTSRGQLINILAHYPLDGQPATVQLIQQLSCLQPSRAELELFPGPLVKNVTHKKSIMDFCELKISEADSNPDLYDRDSYKLIWEFFHLLLRQNGQVVGTDIAELLMNPGRRSDGLPAPSPATSHHSLNELPAMQEDDLTNKYRNLLIYGNTKAALEWAMKHGLWGHALFLASKMDQRTYASVMTRFANGLSFSDPLQTLYQLMSGRQPAAVTCCFDEKWGDWRPHLAMILSNSSGREDVKNRAIATLGDTLASRGALYAAHFCYMLAEIEFGNYGHKSSKIVLITSSHALPFQRFATNEAIFATEIFEYALSLAGEFVLPHFQAYKLLMAQRLAEVGMCQEAVHYTEVIATTIVKQPAIYPPSLIQQVYDLGDMLKLSDPVYTSSDNAGADLVWLQQLLVVLRDYKDGVLQHQVPFSGSISNLTTYSEPEEKSSLPTDVPDQPWLNGSMYQPQATHQPYQQQWAQDPEQSLQPEPYIDQLQQQQQQQQQQQSQPETMNYGENSSTDTPSYWTPPPVQNQWSPQPADSEPFTSPATPSVPPSDYYDPNRSEAAPTITLPGASSARLRTTSQSQDVHQSPSPPRNPTKEAAKGSQQQQHQQQQGSGWFGGIFSKLSLRPKNQMILPDDKNPSIVWDADKKRWVNQNAEEDDGPSSLPPPPMMGRPGGPLPPGPSSLPPGSAPHASSASASNAPMPPSAGPNMYKMSRGKNLRANYVDVMNPGGKNSQPSALPAPDLFPSLSYSAQPNLFIPQPVEGQEGGMNMFTPAATPAAADQQESRDLPAQGMSRWSSASSLSREVQTYTRRPLRTLRSQAPSGLAHNGNGQWNNDSIGGTLPRAKRSYR